MIQALNPVSFRGTAEVQQEPQEKKAGIKDAAKATRDVALNTLKGFNNVTTTSYGVAKGVVEGGVAAALIGVLGKNIKNSENSFSGTIGGILKDLGHGAAEAIGAVPALITKAPLENAKSLIKLPNKFFKEYLKGHKLTAAFATSAAVGILAYQTIRGKMHANLKNADVEHRTNTGHIK